MGSYFLMIWVITKTHVFKRCRCVFNSLFCVKPKYLYTRFFTFWSLSPKDAKDISLIYEVIETENRFFIYYCRYCCGVICWYYYALFIKQIKDIKENFVACWLRFINSWWFRYNKLCVCIKLKSLWFNVCWAWSLCHFNYYNKFPNVYASIQECNRMFQSPV